MKRSEAAKIVSVLKGAYPSTPLTMETAEVYEAMFADLGYDETQAVVVSHIATRKWFPKISEIREAVISTRLALPSVDEALRLVMASQRGELPCTWSELPEAIREAMRLNGGSWEMQYSCNPTAWRAQFRATYESLRERAIREVNVEGINHELLTGRNVGQLGEGDPNAPE